MPVDKAMYVLGLTFEKHAPFKKLRVMLASEEMLQGILAQELSVVTFEESLHTERWDAMKLMAQMYSTSGTNNPNSCLWKVQIAIPRIPVQGVAIPGDFPTATPLAGAIQPAKD